MADSEPLEKTEEPTHVMVCVRMPVALHEALISFAQTQNTDKSKLIISAVAERMGMNHLLSPWGASDD